MYIKLFVASALLSFALFAVCKPAYSFGETKSWSYKTIVTVETPEGEKTGSAVRKITVSKNLMTGKYYPKIEGEAVVVDLGKRGVLFGLLSSFYLGTTYATLIPNYVFPAPDGKNGFDYLSGLTNAEKKLDISKYPMFVHFQNLTDPKTAELVIDMTSDKKWPPTYSVKSDGTEKIFGNGVKIKSVLIEMTDEPVTHEVSKWLPWLNEFFDKRLDGQRDGAPSKYSFANSISSGSFKSSK